MSWTLDRVLPRYDKREQHSRWIAAPPQRVWDALMDLRVRDLALTVALARLRGGPVAWLRGVDGPLDLRAVEAMAPRPIASDPPRELLLGDIARYAAVRPSRPDIERGDAAAFESFDEPGWSKVAMNFLLTPERDGTLLSTETRVVGTDAAARLAFEFYWVLVRLGSGLVRRDILNAIARSVA
ncbi:hypothetical protein F0L68_30200 [Solihabitans fulvus]|uniref:DUF2867 domain-containing protein n=1 Tax=Solihabitans fulvus TaxID=1892852 RepID=A0A5B2WTX4_9PSEU|nr:hypothetical protein [Solihabitans fulvus]KAA2254458.1 hypothetical protein F0L68_30200 [Solihabitans fulvus]